MVKIKVHLDCDGCGECADVCPNEAIKIIEGKAVLVEEDDCVGCGSCVEVCVKGNIEMTEE